MTADITLLSVLFAGLISFLSPCVLPLVPPYLCYMAGTSLEELTGDDAAPSAGFRKILPSALLFVLGFTVVFVTLGAGASTIGQFVRSQMDILAYIAGIIIIVMGMHFLGLFKIGFLYREARFQSSGTGYLGAFAMGLAFAFGWTPCIGPVLGVVLGVAGSRESVSEGAFLLAVYSAGLGVPFILAAVFVQPFMNFLVRFRRHLGLVEKGMGAMLVLTGILFITGGMERFAFWMLETFPALGQLG